MRPQDSAEVLEDRHRRVRALLRRRWSLKEVARKLGSTASFVMRWRNTFRQHGPAAL